MGGQPEPCLPLPSALFFLEKVRCALEEKWRAMGSDIVEGVEAGLCIVEAGPSRWGASRPTCLEWFPRQIGPLSQSTSTIFVPIAFNFDREHRGRGHLFALVHGPIGPISCTYIHDLWSELGGGPRLALISVRKYTPTPLPYPTPPSAGPTTPKPR